MDSTRGLPMVLRKAEAQKRFSRQLRYQPDVHSTRHLFLTVHAAVTPTSVLPAPAKRKKERRPNFTMKKDFFVKTFRAHIGV